MMVTESSISKDILIVDQNAAYDAACKRILSEKIILAQIMKACVKEYRDIDINEISEKYIEGIPEVGAIPVEPDTTNATGNRIQGMRNEDSSLTEGTVTYDIRFYAIAPTTGEPVRIIINIEAQSDFYPGYPLIKRGIYYCSRMISAQYETEFTESHYEKIKKVYSIWICVNPPKNRQNTITRYYIKEAGLVGTVAEKPEYYDLLEVIMICLGKENHEHYKGILKLLDVLFSSDIEAKEKQGILQKEFDIAMTQELESEVSLMCNLSKGVEEKGIAKGIAKGKSEERMNAIRNLMESLGFTVEEAMKALKIPVEEQFQLLELLH